MFNSAMPLPGAVKSHTTPKTKGGSTLAQHIGRSHSLETVSCLVTLLNIADCDKKVIRERTPEDREKLRN